MVPGLVAGALLVSTEMKVMFVGNSHTLNNNVPGMVCDLIKSGGANRSFKYEVFSVGLLNQAGKNVFDRIAQVKWDYIVLQGAEISSSHKYTYSQDVGISVAKAGVKSGAIVLLYAEWPRRGWDETAYINNVYRGIAKASRAKVVSVGEPWDKVLKLNLGEELWAADGNHASLHGSYIAARTLSRAIDPVGAHTWRPNTVSAKFARALDEVLPPVRDTK
ncbi:MAG: hypothetical protein KF824_07215 [Fimbriimonadaceae bacterium]|nr:MAG: hypothetical protein KF824_07215 [Fimbriimonadaceae bacterium]